MLYITVPGMELWDEKKEEFVYLDETTIQLEHSLVSISKWESKWHKPFLLKNEKTDAEILDYIKCMTITQHVKPDVYFRLSKDNVDEIKKYIEDSMTATTFMEDGTSKGGREVVTSELIYYWMVALNIPSEYQKWHLNRLLTLIRVCNIKNAPPKKRGKREIMSRNAALNAARRKQYNTRG
jgi:hypothetical protein